MWSSEHNGVYISPPIRTSRLVFGKEAFSSLYANQFHNFTNLIFCDGYWSLSHSLVIVILLNITDFTVLLFNKIIGSFVWFL